MSFQKNIEKKASWSKLCSENPPCDLKPCNNFQKISLSQDGTWNSLEDECYSQDQNEQIRPAIHCNEKPKKRLWQQWFSDKCLSLRKNLGRKTTKTKTKNDKDIICKPVPDVTCSLSPPPKRPKIEDPVSPCRSNVQPCSQRVCPPPPHAICGCHFYFNIGKIARRKQGLMSNKIRNKHISSLGNCVSQENVNKVCGLSKEETELNASKNFSSNDGIQIGVTLTKEETKYLPELSICDKMGKQNETSDQILTLEISKGEAKINQIRNQSIISEEKGNAIVREFHKQGSFVPKLETYNRKIKLLQKNNDSGKSLMNGYTEVPHCSQNELAPKDCLDRQVLEILRKLENIEKRMKVFENKGKLSNNIEIDVDGQKSRVSVNLKHGCINNSINIDEIKGFIKKENLQSDDGIESRENSLKSQSPCGTSYEPDHVSHNIQCPGKYEDNNQAKQKIVIKLPNNNNRTYISYKNHPPENDYVNCSDNSIRQSTYSNTWYHIANSLKLCVPGGKCYCPTCCSKDNFKVHT